MPLGARLALQIDGAALAGLGDGLEGRLVERFILGKGVLEDLRREVGRHRGQQFVTGH